MKSSIETLVDTWLQAYGDADAARRRATIERIWNGGGRLVDPPLQAVGHAGISDQAATLVAQFPGHTFHRTTDVDAHHEFARYDWSLRGPDGADVLQGTDVLWLDVDGRILQVVGFFGAPRPLA